MNSKWAGWAATGAILMVIVGAFKAISGFIGLFNDEWLVRGFNAYYFIDVSALAWWYLIVGVILVLAGLAVMNGKAWGRWVGVFAAGVAIISELLLAAGLPAVVDPLDHDVRVHPHRLHRGGFGRLVNKIPNVHDEESVRRRSRRPGRGRTPPPGQTAED